MRPGNPVPTFGLAGGEARRGVQIEGDRDFGHFVLGGSMRQGDIASGASSIPNGLEAVPPNSVQIRAGYDFGPSLGYVTFGTHRDRSLQSGDVIESLGVGLRLSLNRALSLTGEYLHYTSPDNGQGIRRETDSLALRAAFRF